MYCLLRRALIFLTAFSLILPVPGLAQSSQDLERLNVSLWPEYDRRAMLVIYQVRLPEDADLPAQVPLPMPASAGAPHAVATMSQDGSLVNAPYELTEQGEWLTVFVQADSRTLWLEYYTELSFRENQREFVFRWPGTLAVQQFSFEVQRPPGSSEFQIVPAGTGQRSDSEGLSYTTGVVGPLSAGEHASIQVRYTRNTDQLTVDMLPGAASVGQQVSDSPTERTGWHVYGLVGAALLVLAAGAYMFRRRLRLIGTHSGSAMTETVEVAAAAVFCHNCGSQSKPDDRFCRNCGTRLRTEA